MVETKKPFWKSKTKIAALLIGVGPVLVTIGSVLNGTIDIIGGLKILAPQVGLVLAVFGIRDWNIINRIK